MSRANVPFFSFNRGLISPKALARVDLERTALSAEVYTNFIPKTIGAMTIRPGTKYVGSSLSDTGAQFIEFVAATDDVALPELTHNKMRIWLGSDAHSLALLGRPKVDTTLTLSDTGWANTSSGGAFSTPAIDTLPTMTAATTSGVTVSASSENTSSGTANRSAWKAADDDITSRWEDTGDLTVSSLPSWWKVNFGAGNTKAITSYSIRAAHESNDLNSAPQAWTLQYNDVDTGDGWTTVDSRSAQTGWAVSEKRTFTRLDVDTGTVEALRYWRLNFTAGNGSTILKAHEIEMFVAATAQQVKLQAGKRIFNTTSIGALARAEKRVMLSDTGTEHSLAIDVERGPVTLRVGSSQRDDDYVRETSLGTGYHNLAFTPTTNFWVTVQHDGLVDRIVRSLGIGDSGTVELTAPWAAANLDNVRYDQSADVVYVDCEGVRPSKIERRGTGRSWSVVDYAPDNGPFLPSTSSSAKMEVSHFFGNTTLNSSIPFFTANHVGALVRIFHEGQGGQWRLGALDAATDAVQVTGLSDTGSSNAQDERTVVFSVTGTWSGTILLERSFDGKERGFHAVPVNFMAGSAASDTGTFTRTVKDTDDNIKVYYLARVSAYTSGVPIIAITYAGGGTTGIARITSYSSNTAVSIEVLSRFSDTGTSDNWQQGYWSAARSYPTAVALHGGRLGHAEGGSVFLSVADDYENFNEDTVGDAAPIIRTLGSGPVDSIHYLISLLRLVIGTAGAELAVRSSSLDEPLTADNSGVLPLATQGSANVRALRMDTRAIMVQRSKQRVFMLGPAQNTLADYESFELTQLVPDLLAAGVVSIAVQRQPDTRLHCVLANGKVAILTYEPQEEVVCWSMWEGDTGTVPTVEKAAVLPGIAEDAVYYHIRRTINGATKRYLEKWAKESECLGDTGTCFLMDCAATYADTGRTNALAAVATHLVGESVVGWGDLDTGSTPYVDLSPDNSAGVQTRYTVSAAGTVTLSLTQGVHRACVGLPFKADWKSAKLAYAAQMGTALNQMKRAAQVGFVLHQTHPRALEFGADSGHLDHLPDIINEGQAVDVDQIFASFDQIAFSMNSTFNTDARLHLRAKSPRPCTVLAAVISVQTNER